MFEVGFQELALIFGVALIVLGPKRMSGLVTKVGRWVGKARVMARDFRQQLENEVNLEELNRMTDLQTRQARENQMPVPPEEFTGAPMPEVPTYPYSAAPEATAETPAAAPAETLAETSTTDDTYSHAHAAGDAPMPYTPEPETLVSNDPPAQADLDLSIPDESHLPPDDARRTT
jgi:sec-independent protein translocase protein TatB